MINKEEVNNKENNAQPAGGNNPKKDVSSFRGEDYNINPDFPEVDPASCWFGVDPASCWPVKGTGSARYDILIVGAGLYGCTVAYEAAKKGLKCLVIDKRPHIAGNLYCEDIKGITTHKYGAHIFHTSDKEIWDYVNNIHPFDPFINSPVANYNGELYNLPFNMNTFYQMWGVKTPEEAKIKIDEEKKEYYKLNPNKEIKNLEDQAISLVGPDIYEKLIKGYTMKQWGKKCDELPAFIIKRLPLRFTYNNNYFNDYYQGIPRGGYNHLCEKMLKGHDILLNTDFFNDIDYFKKISDIMVYTGPIDRYYNYIYGELEYRSLNFETELLNTDNYQGNAVINYTDEKNSFTRVIEHKHFEPFNKDVLKLPHTVVTKEYSVKWNKTKEAYYPVNDDFNNNKYLQYKALADKEKNIYFGGRLAEYKYYDMDKTLPRAVDALRVIFSLNF